MEIRPLPVVLAMAEIVAVAATVVPAPVVPLLAPLLYAGPRNSTPAPVEPVKVPSASVGLLAPEAGAAETTLPPELTAALANVWPLAVLLLPLMFSVPPPSESAELELTILLAAP